MSKFIFEWDNGRELVEGKDYKDACRKIKTPIKNIKTGVLIRIMPINYSTVQTRKTMVWHYWDAKLFWKCLKGKKELVKK